MEFSTRIEEVTLRYFFPNSLKNICIIFLMNIYFQFLSFAHGGTGNQFEVEVDVENWADEVSHNYDGDAGDNSITTVKSVKDKSY